MIVILIVLSTVAIIYFDDVNNKLKENLCKEKGYEGIKIKAFEGKFCYKYDENDILVEDIIRGLR